MRKNNEGLELIPFTIVNDSGSKKEAYLYLYSNKSLYYLSDFNGTVKAFGKSQPQKSYGLPLAARTTAAFFPQLEAVRIYVSFGAGLEVPTNPQGFPGNVDDRSKGNSNYFTLFDFVEANWPLGAVGPVEKSRLHINTTQVDAFGLAFQFEVHGLDPADPTKDKAILTGFSTNTARANIFNGLQNAGPPWSDLLILNAQEEYVRALQPGVALSTRGQYKFPNTQLDAYIADCLKYYAQATKKLVTEYAGVNYTFSVVDGKFVFTPDKTSAKTYTIDLTPPGIPSATEAIYRNAIVPIPDDGPGRRVAAVLGASLLRSTLAHPAFDGDGFPVPRELRKDYYTESPVFQYAKIIHEYGINSQAFCYGYDEVALDAGNGEVVNPTSISLTIRGGVP
jgi:hypothetical protein